MSDNQIIYPSFRLLANPRIFIAIANHFDGPDWEILAAAFYDLIESELLEIDMEVIPESEVSFEPMEVCFREKPDEEAIYQVILSNGQAIELRPTEGEKYSLVSTDDDLGAVSAIYGRLVRAIEEERPDLAGDIALCVVPHEANGYLRSKDGDSFAGEFHLLSDPSKLFNFKVNIVDMSQDELKAEIEPKEKG